MERERESERVRECERERERDARCSAGHFAPRPPSVTAMTEALEWDTLCGGGRSGVLQRPVDAPGCFPLGGAGTGSR